MIDAIVDLISMLVFFLAWLLPILLIFFLRGRSARRQSQPEEEKSVSEHQKYTPAPRRAREDEPGNFIARLMEIQGIEPQEYEASPREQDRSLHVLEEEQYPRKQQSDPIKAESLADEDSYSRRVLQQKRRRTSVLEQLDRYPPGQRAIILSEIIGRPRAFSDRV